MAIKTYLYTGSPVTTEELDPRLASGASPTISAVLGKSQVAVTLDETNKDDLDDAMEDLGYVFLSEYTGGAALSGRTDYGVLAADPTGITPIGGDTYYNTALQMNMSYDSTRSKWLSVESETIPFGRDGNVGAEQFFRAINGRIMSGTLGFFTEYPGTVVALSYTRSDSDAATFDVVADGVSVEILASSSTTGADTTLDGDFTAGQVLAVQNQAGGNPMSNVVAKFRVRWRSP